MKKNKKDLIILSIIYVFTLLVFFNFVNMHYATDTYNIINRGYKEYAIKYSLNDGRPIMCLISLFADALNLSINIYIVSLIVMALFVSCISVMKLKNVIKRYKQINNLYEEIVLLIICYFTIFNFMYLENMYFAECLVMSISILLFIISMDIFLERKKFYIEKSLLLAMLGVLFYQGTIGFFVSITCLISIIKNKDNIKEILKDIIISGIFCCIAVGINLLQIKICGSIFNMSQNRISGSSEIFINIKYICMNLPVVIINTASMFPKYILLVYMILLFICCWFYYLKKGTKELVKMLYIVLIICISFGDSLIINVFTLTSFGAARLLFSIGALVGFIYIYIFTNTNLFKEKKAISKLLKALLAIYCIITVVNYIYIMSEHKKIEVLNEEECMIIDSYIKEYEEESGKIVKKIAVYYDIDVTYYYPSIKDKSSLCLRPLSVEWADNASLTFYSGRKLEQVNSTYEIYREYFKGKNWDKLDKEQFVFIDDTVHYCIY